MAKRNGNGRSNGATVKILTAIDESLSESVDFYVRVRHRTLEALDEVAQVVTGPGDIDSILHRDPAPAVPRGAQ